MYQLATNQSKADFCCPFGWIIAAQGGAFWSLKADDLINIYLIFHALKFQKKLDVNRSTECPLFLPFAGFTPRLHCLKELPVWPSKWPPRLQMPWNLIYLKANILNLKEVVKAVNHPFNSWSQKMDKTGPISGWTGQQAVGLAHDVSDQCMHFLDFLGVVGLFWDWEREVMGFNEMVPSHAQEWLWYQRGTGSKNMKNIESNTKLYLTKVSNAQKEMYKN